MSEPRADVDLLLIQRGAAGTLLPPDTWDAGRARRVRGLPGDGAHRHAVVLEAGATARIDVRLE